ncbi:MAG: hypothetical protein WD875_04175 [Pirellulales bacterium]
MPLAKFSMSTEALANGSLRITLAPLDFGQAIDGGLSTLAYDLLFA